MSNEAMEYDLLGLGFGPANLAIAIALAEDSRIREAGLRYGFIERKPAFEWHGGMLLDDTRMQVSFLKDLATLRNPASRYTFINYLHERQRLAAFINLGTFFPSRLEYNDYMAWAAAGFADKVGYGETAVSVEPVLAGGAVSRLRVISESADGRRRTRLTRNLVIGMGGQARVPAVFADCRDDRLFHSSAYLHRIGGACPDRAAPYRLAVVGAGQSAAEVFNDLVGRFPQAQVELIHRSKALKPSDDSPFVNEIFDPAFTDVVYGQSPDQRAATLRDFAQTNYTVVDLPLLERMYECLYLQRVHGRSAHRIRAAHEIATVDATDAGVSLGLRDLADGRSEQVVYDAVVLATGYRRDGYRQMLDGLSDYLADGGVSRSYRVPVRADVQPAIYLQGCCEDSHGLSDTLLSVLAVRAQEVVDDLMGVPHSRLRVACA